MSVFVNGLNISDNINYLVEEITFRSAPMRDIITNPISTRPGDKLVTSEWRTKDITIKGRIFSTTASGIASVVDTLQQNFAGQSVALITPEDRTYTVTLKDLQIPNQFYNNSMVEYAATFQASNPFAYGPAVSISGTVQAGTLTFSGIVTISGTVFAEPTLTLTPTTISGVDAGDSGIAQFKTTYLTTGEAITVSGMNSQNIQYGTPMVIDYQNFLVTQSGVSVDYSGVFARWEPGTRSFTIMIASGILHPYKYIFSYSPRYYE